MATVDLPSGIRIRYDDRGPRDGRPLVLAHGFGVSLGMWAPQRVALSLSHRLITWDARGHGGSSEPTDIEAYTMPALARDLRALLEHLDAADGAVIGGMSFGGMIALQYAVTYPSDVHALILSDTTTRGPQPVAEPGADEVRARATEPGVAGGYHAMRTRPDLTEAIATLEIPTLVIVGEHDDLILPGLHRLGALPRARTVTLTECSHGTSGQHPRRWNEVVLRFLDDVDAGAPLGEHEVR